MKGFSTRAIHLKALKKDPYGSLNFPVYDSVAFEFDTAEDIAQAFEGEKPLHTYSRITNPTVENPRGGTKISYKSPPGEYTSNDPNLSQEEMKSRLEARRAVAKQNRRNRRNRS